MGEIVTVNFRGDELYGFREPHGSFVALRPVAEAVGLAWGSQYNRLMRDPVLSEGIFMTKTPFSVHGQQELCLKLELLPGFLFGIDSSRIKDEDVRAKVILYQRECFEVLDAHFNGRRSAPRQEIVGSDEEPTTARTFGERLRHVNEVRQTFDSVAAREVYFALGLLVTPAMLKPTQGDLFTFNAIRHPDRDAA